MSDHLERQEFCENCHFRSDVVDEIEGDDRFYCLRFPPVRSDNVPEGWDWPLVAKIDWCGEWKPR
jgi:hypothetical protein